MLRTLTFISALTFVSTLNAGVLLDNNIKTTDATGLGSNTSWRAQSFNTGSTAYTLDSIILNLGATAPYNAGGLTYLCFDIRADVGGSPAQGATNALEMFMGPMLLPSGLYELMADPSMPLQLAANTTYWFNVGVIPGPRSVNGGALLNYTADPSAATDFTDPTFGTFGVEAISSDEGANWTIQNTPLGGTTRMQLQINASVDNTPEPASFLLAGVGLALVEIRRRTRS